MRHFTPTRSVSEAMVQSPPSRFGLVSPAGASSITSEAQGKLEIGNAKARFVLTCSDCFFCGSVVNIRTHLMHASTEDSNDRWTRMSQNAKLSTPIGQQRLPPNPLKTAESATIRDGSDDTLERGFAAPLKKGPRQRCVSWAQALAGDTNGSLAESRVVNLVGGLSFFARLILHGQDRPSSAHATLFAR
jgi:hypothetical protein